MKNFVFQPKNVILSHKNLVRKLRANGDKVIQFFRFPEGYYVQTSDEMKILGTFSLRLKFQLFGLKRIN